MDGMSRSKKMWLQGRILFVLTMIILPFQNCSQFAAITNGNNSSSSTGAGSNLAEKPLATRRLSNLEYLNSVEELFRHQFGVHSNNPDFGTFLIQNFSPVFRELPVDQPLKKMATDQVAICVSQARFSAYIDIANTLARDQGQSVGRLNQFVGNCVVSQDITSSAADQACAKGFILEFGSLAFRQPPSETETAELLKNVGSWKFLIARIMIHPRFLMRMERSGTKIPNTNIYQLTAYELEARLASVFWKSLPDDVGVKAAANGSILTTAGYKAEVNRILSSPKAEAGLWSFYQQWLAVSRIPNDFRSGDVFDGFAGSFDWQHMSGANVQKDGRDFLKYITWQQNGMLKDVFRSTAIMTTDPVVASIYGVAPRANDAAPPVMDPTGHYTGILTRPMIMQQAPSINSEINHILRGTFLMANIIGVDLGPPANFADQETQGIVIPPTASTRTQVTLKTSLPACIGCHSQINPVGFAFGNFDSFGRYITRELRLYKTGNDPQTGLNTTAAYADNQVNSQTTVKLDGKNFDIDGVAGFVDAIFTSGKIYEAFTKHYLQFALGRVAQTDDDNALTTAMIANLKTKSIRDTLEAFALNPAFARAQAPSN